MTTPVAGYDPGVSSLLEDGWVLRCGNCARRLKTDFAPRVHRVYDDLSGRCFVPENDGVVVSTFFFADPRESRPLEQPPAEDGNPITVVGIPGQAELELEVEEKSWSATTDGARF